MGAMGKYWKVSHQGDEIGIYCTFPCQQCNRNIFTDRKNNTPKATYYNIYFQRYPLFFKNVFLYNNDFFMKP